MWSIRDAVSPRVIRRRLATSRKAPGQLWSYSTISTTSTPGLSSLRGTLPRGRGKPTATAEPNARPNTAVVAISNTAPCRMSQSRASRGSADLAGSLRDQAGPAGSSPVRKGPVLNRVATGALRSAGRVTAASPKVGSSHLSHAWCQYAVPRAVGRFVRGDPLLMLPALQGRPDFVQDERVVDRRRDLELLAVGDVPHRRAEDLARAGLR
jgi:hypothetical protein